MLSTDSKNPLKKIGVLDKNKFYKIDSIIKEKALYNIIYGERSNGKSYAVKTWCMEEAYNFDRLFCLVFRYKEDKKTNGQIESYFDDCPIKKLTKGEYDGVKVRSDIIYFTYKDEHGKKKMGKECGYVAKLDDEEKNKSLPFNNCYNVIFEEFISRRAYLVDEVTKLQSLISTVVRLRLHNYQCRVFLIGNLISQVNPYRLEWNLFKMDKQKAGTIDTYEITTETGSIKIAVERCKAAGLQGGIAINSKGQAMEKGEWEVQDVPVFDSERKDDYREGYVFVYTYMGSYFLCKLLINIKNSCDMLIYIEKKTTSIKPNTRVIGDIYDTSILYTQTFKPLVDRERIIFDLIKQGKIAFSDRLTGTNFYTCYNTMKKNTGMY